MTADGDYTAVSGQTLNFATGVTTQPLDVTVNDDNRVETNETFTVSLSNLNNGGRNVTAGAGGTGTIQNDDVAGFTVSETASNTSVAELGTTDTFDVVLTAQPNTDVVLTVTSGDTGESTVSPATLTFTNANWSIAQTVTMTGVDDNIIDGTQTTTITLSVDDTNSDDKFDSVIDQTVYVTTTDDDVAGFTVSETANSTSVAESGSTDTFDVVLTAQPDSDVVLNITSGDTGESTISPESLTFTNSDWNSAQTVTVTGVDDSLLDGTQTTTVTLSVEDDNSDNNFDSLIDQTVSVTTTDDDVAGFTVSETDGNTSVTESGSTDTFDVVLDAQPDSDVVLTVTSGDTGEATVSPATLTFTNANWSIAQTVTVTGVDDNIIDGTQTTTSRSL